MENQQTSNLYPTRDLPLAAALITLKFKLAGINYQCEGNQSNPVGYFNFTQTAELEQTLGKYLKGELLVEPKEFMYNVRALKSEVVSTYSNPRAK